MEPSGNASGPDELINRVDRIESRLHVIEQQLSLLVRPTAPPLDLPPPRPEDRSVRAPMTAQPAPQYPMPGPSAPVEAGRPPVRPDRAPAPAVTAVETETVLKWTGVVLVVLAAAFLVSTAISRGWIGPEMQLAGATVGGFALLGASLRLRRRHPPWAGALAHGGIVVLGICAGAAYAWLGLVPLGVTAIGLAAVVALALTFGRLLNDQNLAATGLVTSVVVPWAIDAQRLVDPDLVALWLGGAVAVSVAVAAVYGWVWPRLAGLATVGLLLPAFTLTDPGWSTTEARIIQVVVALVGVAWWLGPWFWPADGPLRSVDRRLVMIVPALIWLASISLWADTDDQLAFAALVTVVGFLAVTVLVRALAKRSLPGLLFHSYLVGLSTLASAGLGFWLDGPTLLIALTTQAVGLVWLLSREQDVLVTVNVVVLGVILGTWTAAGLVDGVQNGLAWADAVGYLYVVIAAVVICLFAIDLMPPLVPWIMAVAWVALLAWIAAVLGHVEQGQMLVSLVWAVLGIIVVALGIRLVPLSELPSWAGPGRLRQVGLATLAATVLKLVTVDLAEVDTIWRALLFLIVGLGLLRLGFTLSELDEPGPVLEETH